MNGEQAKGRSVWSIDKGLVACAGMERVAMEERSEYIGRHCQEMLNYD